MQGRTLLLILIILSRNVVTSAPVSPSNSDPAPTSGSTAASPSSPSTTTDNVSTSTSAAPPSASSSVGQAEFTSADRPDPVPADGGSRRRRNRMSWVVGRGWDGVTSGWGSQWSEGGAGVSSVTEAGPSSSTSVPRKRSANRQRPHDTIYLPPASQVAHRKPKSVQRVSSTPRCPFRAIEGHRCTPHCLTLALRQHAKESITRAHQHPSHIGGSSVKRKRYASPEPIEFAHDGGGGLSLGPYGGEVIDGVLVRFNSTYNASSIALAQARERSEVVARIESMEGTEVTSKTLGARHKDDDGEEEGEDGGDDENEQDDGKTSNKSKSDKSEDENDDDDDNDSGKKTSTKSTTDAGKYGEDDSTSSSKSSKPASTSDKGNDDATEDASHPPPSTKSTSSGTSSTLPGSLADDCSNLQAMYTAMGGAYWTIQYGWDGNTLIEDQASDAAEAAAIASAPVSNMVSSVPAGPIMSLPSAAAVAARSWSSTPHVGHQTSSPRRKRHGSGVGSKFAASSLTTTKADPTCCSWYGVGCSTSGRVNSLDLANNGLSGSLAAGVYQLNALTRLNVSNNPITFVPDGFQSLTSLKTVEMSSLAIPTVMPLPSTLQSLPTLVNIDIASNNFSGPAMFSSGYLQNVHLDNNLLSSVGFAGNQASLLRVSFAGNGIGGSLPDLSRATGLISLDGSNNKFTGDLFDIRALTSLTHLDVSSNGLTGGLPTTLVGNPSLTILDISRNGFIGSLPLEDASAALTSCTVMPNSLMTCPTLDELADPKSLASVCHAECQPGNVVMPGSSSEIASMAAAGVPAGLLASAQAGVNGLPTAISGSGARVLTSGTASTRVPWSLAWSVVMFVAGVAAL